VSAATETICRHFAMAAQKIAEGHYRRGIIQLHEHKNWADFIQRDYEALGEAFARVFDDLIQEVSRSTTRQ
jgi:hypothetical protein